MKDRYAIILVSLIWALLFHIGEWIPRFNTNWFFINPIVVLVLLAAHLWRKQKKRNANFGRHLLSSYGIGITTLILYFFMSLILSPKNFSDPSSILISVSRFVPQVLSSMLLAGIIMVPGLFLCSLFSYLIARQSKQL